MTEKFTIGSNIGDNIDGVSYIQDSVFGRWDVTYFVINEQPIFSFAQSKTDRRINFSFTLSTNDIIIVHFK